MFSMARSIAREIVMQLFFEKSFGGEANSNSREMIKEQLNKSKTKNYVLTKSDEVYIGRIFDGLASKQEVLDKLIQEKAKQWSIDRIGRVDLAILRLAIYELLYEKDTPSGVIINEAVVLAKRYCQAESSKFINGILATILKAQDDENLNPKDKMKSENL